MLLSTSMKIETITQTIEFTIDEKHTVTVCRTRKIVSRAGEPSDEEPDVILSEALPVNGTDISETCLESQNETETIPYFH